jgi:tetratricopeptide (TPR) repeat protein
MGKANLILLFFAITLTGYSQKIIGKLVDSRNAESIPFANVKLIGGKATSSTTTDITGNFIFDYTLADSYKIISSYVGCITDTTPVNTNKDNIVNITIKLRCEGIECIEYSYESSNSINKATTNTRDLYTNSCDPKNVSKSEQKFYKADRKARSDSYKYSDLTFEIAECYRQSNDTTCIKWYRNCLRVSKSTIKGCDRDIKRSNKLINQMAYSAFYLGQYQDASVYFQKVAAYQTNSLNNYMLGLCEMRLGHYENAIVEFTTFKKSTTEFKDVDDLMKECKEKINTK